MKNIANKQSISQIMLKKSLLAEIALSSVLLLSACGNSGGIVADNNSNLNNSIVVEKAAVIPVLDGRATAAGIYIRNTTGKTISGIRYGLAQTNSSTSLAINSSSCNTIAANSSCLLSLTTPALTSGTSGSNMLVATYNSLQSKQLINYRYLDTKNYRGVNFSDNNLNLFGNNDYATVYVFSGNHQPQYNIGFNQSNNSLAVASGLTNGKVDIPADTLVPLEIQSNRNVTSTRVTLTPYTLTTSKGLQKALTAGTENNTTLTVTITPIQQANLLMSDLPLLTKDTPTATLSIFNNGNQSATISSLTASSANVTVTVTASNPCSAMPLPVGASCNYTISKNNNDSNGSAILTLAYNNSKINTTATQTVYYQNSNTIPMVAAVATQTNFSEQINTNNNITFNISNSGNVPLNNVAISAKTTLLNSTLTILNNTCTNPSNTTIAANGSCSLQVNVAASGLIDSGVIYLNVAGNYTNGTTTSYSFISKPVYASIVDTTKPTVTSTDPQDTATSVSTATGIVVNFSKPMTATTLNNNTILLQKASDSSNVPLTSQGVSNNNQTVTFSQTSGKLLDLTNYKIVINPSQITDANGNAISSATSQTIATFTTGNSTPPTISSFNPANGAINQSQTPTINLTFSKAMDQATLIPANIILQTQAGAVVGGTTISYDSATYTATVNLNGTLLTSQTTYLLIVNQNNLKDVDGNAMGTNSSYQVSQFTIASPAVLTIGTIAMVSPGGTTSTIITLSNWFGASLPPVPTYTFSGDPAAELSIMNQCSSWTPAGNGGTCAVTIGASGTVQLGTATLSADISSVSLSASKDFNVGKYIFVTNTATDGNIVGSSGKTAAAAADAICNADSARPNTSVTYKALLVTPARYNNGSGTSSDWPLAANTGYYNASGNLAFTTNSYGIPPNTLDAAIAPSSALQTWTGAGTAGNSTVNWSYTTAADYCTDWTSTGGGMEQAIIGATGATSANAWNYNLGDSCTSSSMLYCVQQ